MKQLLPFILGAICAGGAGSVFSQGTAFLYQGQLSANGSPANGVYDLAFTLFNAGGQTGSALTNYSTPISNGLFSVTLDYGPGVFNGSNLWLQVCVRTNGGGPFTALAPMQPILPAPCAIMANTAGSLAGPLPAAQLSGAGSNMVTLDNAANRFAGSFSGDGSGLANVNAALLNGLAGSNYATADSLTNYATVASLAGSQSDSPIPNVQVFDSPGTFQFTVPSNVTTIAIEVWGGGGGGGGSTSYSNHGSGGGAGGYGKGVFAVAPGDNYTVFVGAAGAGGGGGAGGAAASPGGASGFGALISAGGGSAGTNAPTSGPGGAGGAGTAPINITGGAGQWTSSVGGSDGGSAGNGGSGGRGDTGSSAGAGAGQAPGGGGGGGEGNDAGGSGGVGRVIIYY